MALLHLAVKSSVITCKLLAAKPPSLQVSSGASMPLLIIHTSFLLLQRSPTTGLTNGSYLLGGQASAALLGSSIAIKPLLLAEDQQPFFSGTNFSA